MLILEFAVDVASVALGILAYRLVASLAYRVTRGRQRKEWFL